LINIAQEHLFQWAIFLSFLRALVALFFCIGGCSVINLPGLIDPHVHMREPGTEYKEDWGSGTTAAIAGGFTTVLAMPNTRPAVTDQETLRLALKAAQSKAKCDYGQFLGAGPDNLDLLDQLGPLTVGLKMYLDQTFGHLRLDDMALWMEHFRRWPSNLPIVAHAEARSMAAVILMASIYDRPIHIAHVSLRQEILLIRAAKEKGIKVTCEVTPHHLFLSEMDIQSIGVGRSEVRPRLASLTDQQALWENLDVIDCFATDHAPHTLEEKSGENPPPGFPGLETALPLLLTAVYEGRLTISDLIQRMVDRPREIFTIPEQSETWVEVDNHEKWEISAANTFTRCNWTPFEGMKVTGRIRRVVLRGVEVFRDGQVVAQPGSGVNIKKSTRTNL
jgi:carbamoyl-phosphate synthase/aspartate carbamoyltransferase/dihydroorotase